MSVLDLHLDYVYMFAGVALAGAGYAVGTVEYALWGQVRSDASTPANR